MKASRELKRYMTRYAKHLKACRWDDLMVIRKLCTCKKWYKRTKSIKTEELE